MNIFGRKSAEDEELDEWARHHDDARSSQGMALWETVALQPKLSVDELFALYERANRLVGKRAPADYGEFLVYGYIKGRLDAAVARRDGRDA